LTAHGTSDTVGMFLGRFAQSMPWIWYAHVWSRSARHLMSSQRRHLVRAPRTVHTWPLCCSFEATRPFHSNVLAKSFAYANGQSGFTTDSHHCFADHVLWRRIAATGCIRGKKEAKKAAVDAPRRGASLAANP